MKNQIAIITGVSRHEGIGKAIATQMAEMGIDIFFSYWLDYDKSMPWSTDLSAPDEIENELEKIGVRCASLEIDLSTADSVNHIFESCVAKLGAPTILINNATHSVSGDILKLDVDQLDQHYAVNVRATTLLIKTFVENFKGANGRIINIISGQDLGEMNDEVAYAITKGAVKTLTQTISQQLMKKGITINAVNPGPNDTGWMNDELKSELAQRFPSGRIGNPSDTAKLIKFLVSEDGGWITGQVINSEGGFIRG